MILVTVEFAFLSGITPADPDIYGHLTFGTEILKRGTLLEQDIYSYTAGYKYWINHEWMSEVLFAALWKLGSFQALHWLKLIFLGTYLFLFYVILKQLCQKLKPLKFIFLTAVFGLILYPYLFVRPQLITYLMTQLLLLGLLKVFEDSSWTLAVLPLLFVVWTNAHGGFIAGLGLLFLSWLVSFRFYPEKFQQLSIVSLLCLLGTLINPYGYYIYHQLFRTFSNPYTDRLIQDWQSMLTWDILTHPVTAVVCLAYVTYVSLLWRSRWTSRRWFLFVLTTVCFCVSVTDARNMVFVGLIGLPALAELMPSTSVTTGEVRTPVTVLVIVTVLGVLGAFGGFSTNPDYYFPEDSVDYIKKNQLRGNLAVPFNWGQYCIFHLHPAIKVSLDGRYDTVYPLRVFEDFELKAFNGREWRRIFKKYDTDLVLVPRESPLHDELSKARVAKELFKGRKASVYQFLMTTSGVSRPKIEYNGINSWDAK
ncbi:MAG: hypothetical protein ABEK50_11710 [bacterium]